MCVHGYPLPFRLWASQFETGLPVVVSQHPPGADRIAGRPSSSAAAGCTTTWPIAKRRPSDPARGPFLLDQDGYVAEATTANVVVYREGEGLVSPPHEHILVGVSLGVVQELAAKLSVPFVTRPLTVDELRTADEAMLASTSICVLPIVECDGQPIGSGQPGPIYRRLLAAWSELVGVDIAEQARRFAIAP